MANRQRGPKRYKKGPGGRPETCICPVCGKEIQHKPRVPCYREKCPNCGANMARKFE